MKTYSKMPFAITDGRRRGKPKKTNKLGISSQAYAVLWQKAYYYSLTANTKKDLHEKASELHKGIDFLLQIKSKVAALTDTRQVDFFLSDLYQQLALVYRSMGTGHEDDAHKYFSQAADCIKLYSDERKACSTSVVPDDKAIKIQEKLKQKEILVPEGLAVSQKVFNLILKTNAEFAKDEKLKKYSLMVSLNGTQVLNYVVKHMHGISITVSDTDLVIAKAPTKQPLPMPNGDNALFIAQLRDKNMKIAADYDRLIKIIEAEKLTFVPPKSRRVNVFLKKFENKESQVEMTVCGERYETYNPFHFTRGYLLVNASGGITLIMDQELIDELEDKMLEIDLPNVKDRRVTNFFTRLIKYYERWLIDLAPHGFKISANFEAALGIGRGTLAYWQQNYFLDMLDEKAENGDLSQAPIFLEMISIIMNGQFTEGSVGNAIIGNFCRAFALKFFNATLKEDYLENILDSLRARYSKKPHTVDQFYYDLCHFFPPVPVQVVQPKVILVPVYQVGYVPVYRTTSMPFTVFGPGGHLGSENQEKQQGKPGAPKLNLKSTSP